MGGLITTPPVDATVLALDLARRTGWALHVPGRPVCHGVWDVGSDQGRWRWRRWARLRARLLDLKNGPAGGRIDVIAYERSTFIARARNRDGTTGAPQVLSLLDRGGFYAHIEYFAGHHDIDLPDDMPGPSQIKRHVTGSGNARKGTVMAAMRDRGYDVSDDNEADALALLDLMLWRLAAAAGRGRAA